MQVFSEAFHSQGDGKWSAGRTIQTALSFHSIRAIANVSLDNRKETAVSGEDPSVCIVLNVDQRYLDGAKVTISSLKRNSGLGDIPIVVVTSDTAIKSDPYISTVATVYNLSSDEIKRLEPINLVIDRPLPNDPTNRRAMQEVRSKYFEKFYACKNFGYSANIFLDSDLLCLGPLTSLRENTGNYEFQAAPALIAATIFKEPGEPKTRDELDQFRSSHFHGTSWSRNFNSGVFVASGRCIGDEFVSFLIDKAVAMGGVNGDQPVFNEVMKNGYRFGSLHPWFNVERPYYAAFGKNDFERDLREIKLLHFTGHQKPWQAINWQANEVKNVPYMYQLYLGYLSTLKQEEAALAISTLNGGF